MNFDIPLRSDPMAQPLHIRIAGDRWEIIRTAFVQAVLTVFTFGLYRFWMRTRMRRSLWSAVHLGGEAFTYHGTGLEKFIGFVFAVVILALVLGLAQLGFTFAGFALGSPLALQASILPVIPLVFYAQYRARGYLLSRTRWRGIRFHQAPGAGGFVLLSLGFTLLTILSAGLLKPWGDFRLERYLTDRTSYGDVAFVQRGSSGPLFKIWIMIWLTVAVLTYMTVSSALWHAQYMRTPLDTIQSLGPQTFLFGTLAYLALIFGLLAYNLKSFSYLTSNKHTNTGSRLQVSVSLRSYIFTYIWYFIAATLIAMAIPVMAFMFIIMGMAFIDLTAVSEIISNLPKNPQELAQFELSSDILRPFAFLLLAIIPIVAITFASISATTYGFLTYPMLSVYLSTLEVHQPDGLFQARQRARERAGAADGFADALDLDLGAAV